MKNTVERVNSGVGEAEEKNSVNPKKMQWNSIRETKRRENLK